MIWQLARPYAHTVLMFCSLKHHHFHTLAPVNVFRHSNHCMIMSTIPFSLPVYLGPTSQSAFTTAHLHFRHIMWGTTNTSVSHFIFQHTPTRILPKLHTCWRQEPKGTLLAILSPSSCPKADNLVVFRPYQSKHFTIKPLLASTFAKGCLLLVHTIPDWEEGCRPFNLPAPIQPYIV